MTEHVPFLDVDKMEWEVNPSQPGLWTKMLRREPETGARTALQCIDPTRGYKPPTRPHYHSSEEEIIIVKGSFTFNGTDWLHPMSYCFHPPRTVHGFASDVQEETWFLSRVRKPLDYGFTDEKRDLVPYDLDGAEHARDSSVVVDVAAAGWQEFRGEDGTLKARKLVLSEHPETGEGASLWDFQPGWASAHGTHFNSAFMEMFVFAGELQGSDGTVWTEHCYSYKPAGTVIAALSSPKGALVYMVTGGTLDFQPVERLAELQSA